MLLDVIIEFQAGGMSLAELLSLSRTSIHELYIRTIPFVSQEMINKTLELVTWRKFGNS